MAKGKKKAAKSKKSTKRGSAKRTGAGEKRGGQLNVDRLERAHLLTDEYLHPDVLEAIRALKEDEVKTLISINERISLNAFFRAIGPQRGGGGGYGGSS